MVAVGSWNRWWRLIWISSNMLGNAEWLRIREALRTHFPEASAWTEWQQQSDSVTSLPTTSFPHGSHVRHQSRC